MLTLTSNTHTHVLLLTSFFQFRRVISAFKRNGKDAAYVPSHFAINPSSCNSINSEFGRVTFTVRVRTFIFTQQLVITLRVVCVCVFACFFRCCIHVKYYTYCRNGPAPKTVANRTTLVECRCLRLASLVAAGSRAFQGHERRLVTT